MKIFPLFLSALFVSSASFAAPPNVSLRGSYNDNYGIAALAVMSNGSVVARALNAPGVPLPNPLVFVDPQGKLTQIHGLGNTKGAVISTYNHVVVGACQGNTNCSLFQIEADGRSAIVYRDPDTGSSGGVPGIDQNGHLVYWRFTKFTDISTAKTYDINIGWNYAEYPSPIALDDGGFLVMTGLALAKIDSNKQLVWNKGNANGIFAGPAVVSDDQKYVWYGYQDNGDESSILQLDQKNGSVIQQIRFKWFDRPVKFSKMNDGRIFISGRFAEEEKAETFRIYEASGHIAQSCKTASSQSQYIGDAGNGLIALQGLSSSGYEYALYIVDPTNCKVVKEIPVVGMSHDWIPDGPSFKQVSNDWFIMTDGIHVYDLHTNL